MSPDRAAANLVVYLFVWERMYEKKVSSIFGLFDSKAERGLRKNALAIIQMGLIVCSQISNTAAAGTGSGNHQKQRQHRTKKHCHAKNEIEKWNLLTWHFFCNCRSLPISIWIFYSVLVRSFARSDQISSDLLGFLFIWSRTIKQTFATFESRFHTFEKLEIIVQDAKNYSSDSSELFFLKPFRSLLSNPILVLLDKIRLKLLEKYTSFYKLEKWNRATIWWLEAAQDPTRTAIVKAVETTSNTT